MSTHDHHYEITDKLSKKTLGRYITGLVLCLILTFIPFGVVITRPFSKEYMYMTLVICAVLQLFVQSRFFLRLNAGPQGRWSLMSFLFALFVVLVIAFGSLWIMYNLNYNMMH
ncbi:MAG: cytochrome o ubiquinol oxidase subunit IV [Pseudomonadota bacterium]